MNILPSIKEIEGKLVDFIMEFDRPEFLKNVSREELEKVIAFLVEKGRIVAFFDESELLGYIESWRIGFEQLGRIICKQWYGVLDEDITSGYICYLNNIIIHPDYRNIKIKDTRIMDHLKAMFFKQNYMCDYFIGQAIRKRHQPVMVHSRQEAYFKFLNEGVSGNGR